MPVITWFSFVLHEGGALCLLLGFPGSVDGDIGGYSHIWAANLSCLVWFLPCPFNSHALSGWSDSCLANPPQWLLSSWFVFAVILYSFPLASLYTLFDMHVVWFFLCFGSQRWSTG
jgi:hypothetical protein